MEIEKYILLIKKLRKETKADRAIPLCERLIGIAKSRNVPIEHIMEVYKCLLDSGNVNRDALSKFEIDVAGFWGSKSKEGGNKLGTVNITVDEKLRTRRSINSNDLNF